MCRLLPILLLLILSFPAGALAEDASGDRTVIESSIEDGIALELPPGESQALWEELIARSAKTQGDPRGTIRIASEATTWTIEAEDVTGQIRSAPMECPLSDGSRLDISILAVSLLKPALETGLVPRARGPAVDTVETEADGVVSSPGSTATKAKVRPRIALTPAVAVRNTFGVGFSLDLLGGLILPRGMQLDLQGGLVFPNGGLSAEGTSGQPWEASMLAGVSWDRASRVSPVIGLSGGVVIATGRFGTNTSQTAANPIGQFTVGVGFAAGEVVRIQPLAQLRISPAVDTGTLPGAPVQVGGVFGIRVHLSPPTSPLPTRSSAD